MAAEKMFSLPIWQNLDYIDEEVNLKREEPQIDTDLPFAEREVNIDRYVLGRSMKR